MRKADNNVLAQLWLEGCRFHQKARSADQAPADESSRRLSGQRVNKRKKKFQTFSFGQTQKKRANDGDVSADDKRFLKKTDKLISGRIKIIFFLEK